MKTVVKFRLQQPLQATPALVEAFWLEFTQLRTMSRANLEFQIEADNPANRAVLTEIGDVVAQIERLASEHGNQVTEVVAVYGVKAVR